MKKKKLFQYQDVDIIKALEIIAAENTKHYFSDFAIDQETLRQNAEKDEPDIMLWMSRNCGTWCHREKEVLLKYSFAYYTWLHYKDNRDEKILSFAIEITGIEEGIIKGNLYELDYPSLCQAIEKCSVNAQYVKATYESGERVYPISYHIDASPDREYGKCLFIELIPDDPELLSFVLAEAKKQREKIPKADFQNKADPLLQILWKDLGDIPCDPDTEQLESDFGPFQKGADKYEDVWRWFDERYSGGVAALMGN